MLQAARRSSSPTRRSTSTRPPRSWPRSPTLDGRRRAPLRHRAARRDALVLELRLEHAPLGAEGQAARSSSCARRGPDLAIDGEMQADYAVVPEMLEEHYPWATRAAAERARSSRTSRPPTSPTSSSGASPAPRRSGPILLGLKRPVHVLQRGVEVTDIVNMAAIAVVDAQEKGGRRPVSEAAAPRPMAAATRSATDGSWLRDLILGGQDGLVERARDRARRLGRESGREGPARRGPRGDVRRRACRWAPSPGRPRARRPTTTRASAIAGAAELAEVAGGGDERRCAHLRRPRDSRGDLLDRIVETIAADREDGARDDHERGARASSRLDDRLGRAAARRRRCRDRSLGSVDPARPVLLPAPEASSSRRRSRSPPSALFFVRRVRGEDLDRRLAR